MMSQPSEQSTPTTTPARKPVHAKDATVLIVEDNPSNFVLMARMLAYMGVQRCEWKTSGWQVVEFADTLPQVDLILMDIIIKGSIDGIEAACRIRTKFKIPIIFLTAHSDQKTRQRAKMAEPNGYLLKPFHEAELDQVIKLSLGPKAN